jgi:FimV-like protein
MARKNKQAAPAPQREPPAAASPLARARQALEAGNLRRARQLLSEAAASGPEAERREAQALLARTDPDRVALLTAAAILIVIIVAAWLALRAH